MRPVELPADPISTVVALGALVYVGQTARAIKRGGGDAAMSVLTKANGILADKVHELEKQGKLDAAKIAHLQAQTDITVALLPLTRALELHEDHAKIRGDAQLAVLEMLAARLGPDPLMD